MHCDVWFSVLGGGLEERTWHCGEMFIHPVRHVTMSFHYSLIIVILFSCELFTWDSLKWERLIISFIDFSRARSSFIQKSMHLVKNCLLDTELSYARLSVSETKKHCVISGFKSISSNESGFWLTSEGYVCRISLWANFLAHNSLSLPLQGSLNKIIFMDLLYNTQLSFKYRKN